MTQKKTTKEWNDVDRLVLTDIIKHLNTEGYNGWVSFLKDLAAKANLKPLNY